MATNTDIEVRVVAVADKAISDLQKLKKSVSDFGGATEKSFSNSTKSSAAFGASLLKGGLIAAAAAITFDTVKNALVMLYNTGLENEKIQRKLTTALGFTSKALSEQASALQHKGIADDDQIQAMQAMLANYAKSESAILALTPAVLDLSAATGVDMVTAATMVGRAIADDGAELGRYKIKIDGAAGSNERAQSVIDGLAKQFGGQAEEAAKASGAVNTLSLSWGGLMDKVGAGVKSFADDTAATLQYMFNIGGVLDIENTDKELQKVTDKIKEQQKIVDRGAILEADYAEKTIKSLIKQKNAILDKRRALEGLDEFGLTKKTGSGAITGLVGDNSALLAAQKEAAEAAQKAQKEAAQKAQDDLAKKIAANEAALAVSTLDKYFEEGKALEENEAKKQKLLQETSDLKQALADKDKEILAQKLLVDQQEIDAINAVAAAQKAATDLRVQQDLFMANQMVSTMETVATAAGANAEEMKGIRMMEAIVNGAAAIVSANVSQSTGDPWSMTARIIATDALIAAQTIAQIAIIGSAAEGAVVPGNSRTGDRMMMATNSGEMILNERKQQNLLNMLEGGGGGGGIVINLDARNVDASTAYALNRSSRAIAREVEKSFRNGTLSMARLTKR